MRGVRGGAIVAACAVTLAGCSSAAHISQPVHAVTMHRPAATASARPKPASTAETIANRMGLKVTALTAANDPNQMLGRQGGYTSKADVGSVNKFGVSIEVYATVAGASARFTYLQGFAGTFIGDGYDYESGKAILRLNSSYTPAQASALKARFDIASRA